PIIKGFFVIFILFYSLLNLNKSKLHIYLTLFLLSCCFFVGQFFLDFKVDNLNFIENFNRFFKYLSPFIFLLLALDILTLKEYPKKIEIYLKWVLGINNILILIGLLFSLYIFQTYKNFHRFGYDGLIYAQNEASYIFILSISTFYYRRFYLGIKEFFFWLVLIPSFFVGTKAVY